MLKRAALLGLLVCIRWSYAQLDSNSVTVTASRNFTQQPDQTVFAVQVNSGLNTSLEEVIAALQGSGIGPGNFSRVSTPGGFVLGTGAPPQPMLEWDFTLPVPIAKTKDTTMALTALQQSLAQKNSGLTLSFYIQGSQVSQQLQQSQTCPVADLLADARAQAQKLASATGLGAGNVLAISSTTVSTVTNGVAITTLGYSPYAPVCSITVKFALGRF